MNISRSEARIKMAIFWWLMAAVIGLTVAIAMYKLGLWALIALFGGIGATFVMGTWWSVSFLRTDEELAAAAAAKREAEANVAPYRQANAAKVITPAPKPGGTAAAPAPTVPRSAPAPKPAPAPKAEPKAEPLPKPEAAPAAASQQAGEKRPEALIGPRAGGADDLKMIKGIGPKLEKQINALGFYHFDQIAAWTDEEVAWVDEHLEGFKGRVSRDDWVGQAKALMAAV